MTAPTPAIESRLARLRRLHPRAIDLGLGRMRRLLAALGDPQDRLPPVVHVAGTNGKGSTLAFLRAFLEAAGGRVHVYTSPHLVRLNETLRLAGRLIDDEALAARLEQVLAANGEAALTEFEGLTAAAFLAFAETPADALLLETGLGGEGDATNVVARPAVTAISRISFDHREFLGETLAAIAAVKAGIFRPGVPAVLAPQPDPEAAAALAGQAARIGAPVHPWRVSPGAGGGFRFESPRRTAAFPAPALPGGHQIVNAGLALACLDHLPATPVSDAQAAAGLQAVSWPGRLQRLSTGPLAAALPAGWELWLDGGHNDSAGQALAGWLAAQPPLPTALLFGMLAAKRPAEFLAPLARHAARLYALPFPAPRPILAPEAAAEAARAAGIATASPATDPAAALAHLRATAPHPHRLLVCGSLHLVGMVLAGAELPPPRT